MTRAPGQARAAARVRVAATRDGLERVFALYDRFTRSHRVSDRVRRDMYVALEEIVSNVVRHGAATRPVHVNVSLHLDRAALTARIVDDGPAFDPFSVAAPDVSKPIADRAIGGLGVLFVDKLTDEHAYARRRDRNCVVLRRRISAARRARSRRR
ncbi:MAG TPA: ATP-binding protein [Rhodanobacteraceae bacterium]